MVGAAETGTEGAISGVSFVLSKAGGSEPIANLGVGVGSTTSSDALPDEITVTMALRLPDSPPGSTYDNREVCEGWNVLGGGGVACA